MFAKFTFGEVFYYLDSFVFATGLRVQTFLAWSFKRELYVIFIYYFKFHEYEHIINDV